MFLVGPYSHFPGTMLSAIQRIGLTTSLQLCLDAGDINSYDGTSQTWTDVSGGAYSFYRGSTSAAQSTDPTFNGSAGRQSSAEYWSFDGGDYFTLNQANPTWINNAHKNGAKLTIAAWVRIASTVGTQVIMGNYGPSDPSIEFYVASNDILAFNVDSETAIVYTASVATMPIGSWAFIAMSLDESANTLIGHLNGGSNSQSATYSSPSAANNATITKIGANGNASEPIESGGRIAALSAWSTNLSSEQLTAIFNLTRGKFGV